MTRKVYEPPQRLVVEGNRCLVFDINKPLPVKELRHCIALALTYHLSNKAARSASPLRRGGR